MSTPPRRSGTPSPPPEPRGPGRPRAPARPPDALVTAPGVTPVVTVADLDALAERLPSHTHAAIAAELGLSRTHVTHLYRGTKSLNSGAILTLLAKLLREYGVWGARRRAAAPAGDGAAPP